MDTQPVSPQIKDVCATCLSQNRKLFPIQEVVSLLVFCLDVKLSRTDDRICWECNEMLKKLLMFRERAITAQGILKKVIKKRSALTSIRSLSRLNLTKVVRTSTLDAQCNNDDQHSNYVEVEVKTEEIFVNIKEEKLEESLLLDENNIDDSDTNCPDHPDNDSLCKTPVKFESKDNTHISNTIHDNLNDDKDNDEQRTEMNSDSDDVGDENCDTEQVNDNAELKESEVYTIKYMTEEEMLSAREKRLQQFQFKRAKYKCVKCLERFINEKVSVKHNKKHDESAGQFSCSICEQRFRSAHKMDAHHKQHYWCYECKHCKYSGILHTSMMSHYYRVHEINEYTCEKCDQKFLTVGSYHMHKRTHNEKKTCDQCHKKFKTKASLQAHMLIHTGMPVKECPICHKKIRGEGGFRTHMRRHDAKKDESAYCAECNVQYSTVTLYRVHLKTSRRHITEEDKKFNCPHCPKRFVTAALLKDHTDAVHSTPKYKCNYCDKALRTKRKLLAHVREKHEGKPKPRDKICDICSKAFDNKNTLQQHINSHTGARPFVCDICGASFSYSGAMYTHKKLRHKIQKRKSIKEITY